MIKPTQSRRTPSADDLPTSRRRAGSMTVELLLALPVLLTFLFGMVEFSMLLLARQELLTASREGARVAALGGSEADVAQATRLFLGAGSLSQANVQMVLTDAKGAPLHSGSPVAVTVSIPASQAVPDLLAFIGLSIANETLAAQSVMRKE
jgi:Flp pilus assembly protein TadG